MTASPSTWNQVKSSRTGDMQRDACVLITLHCTFRHLMCNASHESARSGSHDANAMALQNADEPAFSQNLSNSFGAPDGGT